MSMVPPFNFARWVSKEIMSSKNIDKKIFIVGAAGDGKSMTGLHLALALDKWNSIHKYGDLSHVGEFYHLDSVTDTEHTAVIDSDDLFDLMARPLCQYGIKLIDDCGHARGFNSRRSMTQEAEDLNSIYGTNRTNNGVTIICVQDDTFADKRMRMLANEVIDMTGYYQNGPFRMAKLWHIRKDNKQQRGIKLTRFMTYENGEWVTQESIACRMPPKDKTIIYDELRAIKQAAQSKKVLDKYRQSETPKAPYNKPFIKDDKERCPVCHAASILYRAKTKDYKCIKGHIFTKPS